MHEPNPVTLEVVGNYLVNAVREMGTTLMRTAYSTVMREQRDCTTALYDPSGNLVAQADHVPSHQGTLSHAAKTIAAQFEMKPEDVFIFNHPYEGGTHHPDIMIFKPIFFEGRQVALAGALGHHIDVGGRSPGSVATDARDVFEEGVIIPAMRLYKEGQFVGEVFAYIKANVRQPKHTLGDIRAQVAAVTVGERRYTELCQKYGAENLDGIVRSLLDHSEAVMREHLAAYPAGTYGATGFMDNDGITDEPVRIEVAVTLDGGDVHVDFTGSSPQVKGPFNCSKSSVYSAVYCAVRYMSDPRIFQNEGCYRPIRVTLPEKSIVSPVKPAPLSGRFHTMERIATTIVAAFNEPRGAEAVGSNHGHLTSFSVSGQRDGDDSFVFFDLLGGGWGGNCQGDGLSATFGFMANCADAPMEAVELEYPLRVERYELLTDSGGPGRYRGGLGVRREVRYLSGNGYFTNRSDAQKFPPPGVLGGGEARTSRHALVRADGTLQELPSKATNLEINADDLIVLETAGGGGYGDPHQRDSDDVLSDVMDGYVSRESAERDYGVVLTAGGHEVDATATASRRRV